VICVLLSYNVLIGFRPLPRLTKKAFPEILEHRKLRESCGTGLFCKTEIQCYKFYERQSARMSKIKTGGLDQYGAGCFKQ